MNRIYLLLLSSFFSLSVFSQTTLPLTADTVKVYKRDNSPAELLLKNSTKDTIGFLFNAGGGRTVFRHGAIKLNDSMYVVGVDTIKVKMNAIDLTNYYTKTQSDGRYLQSFSETDPVFNASAAATITSTNIGNWNTAFSWGNHAGLYRPISYVPSWSEVTGKPSFAAVATTGDYNDLINKPTISTDAATLNSHAGSYYLDYNNFTNIPSLNNYLLKSDTAAMLAHYALDANVVHTSGDESISGTKTFDPIVLQNEENINRLNPDEFILDWSTGEETVATFPLYDGQFRMPVSVSTKKADIYGNIDLTASDVGAYSSSNPNNFINQSGARSALSLTSAGSGAATYNSSTGTFNIPTPDLSGYLPLSAGSSKPLTGTLYGSALNLSSTATATGYKIPSGTSSQLLAADGSTVATSTFATAANLTTTNSNVSTNTTNIATKISIASFIVGELPSGTKNGTNVTFTLANTPISNKEILYVNGVRQKRTTDYTISGATITMIIAPRSTDDLLTDYIF